MTGLGALSVVIPVLDRACELAATLAALPAVGEVVVVDGGSGDDSARVAEDAGVVLVRTAAGRGRQLRAGVERAAGPWLLFLHCDTRLDEAAWTSAAAFIGDPRSAGRAGCFGFALDDPAWQARLVEASVRARVALLALPYGDQGLLIHRSLYASVGGFADWPLMEDVDLVRRLGRRRIAMLPGRATTSSERWRRRGWLRQSASNLECLARFLLGASPQAIARRSGR